MWTRAELKDRAKQDMKPFYWYGVLVCFIAGILGAGSSGGGGSISAGSRSSQNSYSGSGVWDEHSMTIFLIILGVILVVMAIAIVIGIFVSNLVMVGKLRYFMDSAIMQQSAGVGRIFFAFGGGHYLNVMKTMFLRGLFESLWTLLLVIPGIYKHYEYYMIPYLLADNPELEWHEAFQLSKEMMDGNKFHTVVLELSFIGWYLLGMLVCCIGGIFVNPYYEMTFVELYWVLRDQVMGPQPSEPTDQNVYADAYYREM